MFTQYAETQYAAYQEAFAFFKQNPQRLIEAEKFVMDEIIHFIDIHQPEIKRDYDEASYLYSFWKNYPPLERGRAPVGDQYPWIEVGEQVFGNKLQRHFNANFSVKDSGLPSGADDRCIISSERIRQILGLTDLYGCSLILNPLVLVTISTTQSCLHIRFLVLETGQRWRTV